MKNPTARLALLVTALTLLVRASWAQAPGDGILDAIRPHLKDPSKSFTLAIRLKVKEGASANFEAAFATAMKATRKEKGCLAYDVNRLTEGNSDYLIYEKWANLEAIKSHLGTAYIIKLLGQLPELTEGAPRIEILTPAAE